MRNWKNILFVTFLVTGSAFAENKMIVRFELNEQVKKFLQANEFDITGINHKENHIEAVLSETELDLIKAQKSNIQFAFPYNVAGGPDQEYKNPEEIEAFVKEINHRYPSITKVISIGKSVEGRDIWAIKISDNADTDEIEPTILVNGMHHAREVMTPEITTDMVEYLTSNYGQNDQITRWVDNTEIWVVPMFNVDGNSKMWNEDAWWRKNNRGGYGVDINRNYPTAWGTCNGSSSNQSGQDFRGPAPASEPETQAMMNLVASIKPVFDISYHSYSEIVIYPFGCRPNRPAVSSPIESIAAEIGKKLDYKSGTAWELLYNVDGGDIDWMLTEHQVLPFVIEVNSSWQGFYPDYNKWRNKTVLRNRPGWMLLFEKLEGPSLQGRVSEKDFSSIKFSLAGSKTPAQTYKINPDGSFYIMLKPGLYNFTFEGNKTKNLDRVLITEKKVVNF